MKKSMIQNGRAPQLRYDAARGRSARQAVAGVKSVIGKGTIAPRKLQCFSVACIDMPQLEFGDKIVLPSNVLLELQCFKIPTPMIFHVRAPCGYTKELRLIDCRSLVPVVNQQVRAFGAQHDPATREFAQYCSVQEFSAPPGQVFIPYWMMQNLHIAEGADVIITNVLDIPRGIYCRLQPEDTAFLDVAAEIGPKLLMESALRRYSVMSVDETILIDHGNQRFYVKIVELKPGVVVSLLGDVDLEMDFVAPARTDLRRPKSGSQEAELTRENQVDHEPPHMDTTALTAQDPSVSTPVGFGRRLGDGVCVVDAKTKTPEAEKSVSKLGNASFQAARQRTAAGGAALGVVADMVARRADTESLAKDVKLAQAAFTSTGYRLGGGRDQAVLVVKDLSHELPEESASSRTLPVSSISSVDTSQICTLCLSELLSDNMELHTMRCSKNPSYHKFKCEVCEAKVLETERSKHLHCSHCIELFEIGDDLAAHIETTHSNHHRCPDCGEQSFKLVELDSHRNTNCPQALDLCKLCGFKIKRKDMDGHTQACSSRTERCEVCEKYVKILDLDDHIVGCVSAREVNASESRVATTSPSIPTSNQDEVDTSPVRATLECIYCMKRGFIDKRQHDRHVYQECVVARSFRSPMAPIRETTNNSDVKTLIQGKLKRSADAKSLSDSSSRLGLDTTALLQRTTSNNQRDTGPDLLIKPKLQSPPSKPKPRTTHKPTNRPTQLDSLPVKPALPRSPDASMPDLFVGRAISVASSTSANPRLHAQRDTTTRKLQSLHRHP